MGPYQKLRDALEFAHLRLAEAHTTNQETLEALNAQREDQWIWQNEPEHDDLDNLVDDCQIVIRARDLKSLLKKARESDP